MLGWSTCSSVVVVSLLWLNGAIFTLAPSVSAADPPMPNFVYTDNNTLIVFNSVDVAVRKIEVKEDVNQRGSYNTTASGKVTVNPNGTDNLEVIFAFGPSKPGGLQIESFDLTMTFTKGVSGYWSMNKATVNLAGTDVSAFKFDNVPVLSEISMAAPIERSFHCSRFGSLYPAKREGNHTFSIDFRGFQIQPFANGNSFSEAFECVGFFTIGILSGVFVTVILMAVISWGLVMIMNVKTMDRFDDPKGKPVSFGGNE